MKTVKSALAEMTIGGRTYNPLSFLRDGETSVIGYTMVRRAREMGAHLAKEERKHLLNYQDEIPTSFQDEIGFVFTDEDYVDGDSRSVCYVFYQEDRWLADWRSLSRFWGRPFRLLRRIR
jgi:hypothetical protein